MKKKKINKKSEREVLFENIDVILKERGITQNDLSQSIGLHESGLSKSKKTRSLLYDEFYKIVQSLDVFPDELMYTDEERKRKLYLKNNSKQNIKKFALKPERILCPVVNVKSPYQFIFTIIILIIFITIIMTFFSYFFISVGINYNFNVFFILLYCAIFRVGYREYHERQLYCREYIIGIFEKIYYKSSEYTKSYYTLFMIFKITSIVLNIISMMIIFSMMKNINNDNILIHITAIILNILSISLLVTSLNHTTKEVDDEKSDGNFEQYEHYLLDLFSPLIQVSFIISHSVLFSFFVPLTLIYIFIFTAAITCFFFISRQTDSYQLYHKDTTDIETKIS